MSFCMGHAVSCEDIPGALFYRSHVVLLSTQAALLAITGRELLAERPARPERPQRPERAARQPGGGGAGGNAVGGNAQSGGSTGGNGGSGELVAEMGAAAICAIVCKCAGM